jgi:Ca2+-binding RTX toxin-like protein
VVNFAAGETFKTVNVPVLSDAITPEPDETVNLILTAPTGGTLGTQATSVLTIKDVAATTTPPGTLPPGSSAIGNTLQFNDAANAASIGPELATTFPGGVNGGAGDDRFTIPGPVAPATTTPATLIRGQDGLDTLDGSLAVGPITLSGGAGDDQLLGGTTGATSYLVGGAGKDTLTAGAGTDIFAYSGADLVSSISQADLIKGFNGAAGDKIGLAPEIASLNVIPLGLDTDGDGNFDSTALSVQVPNASGVMETKYLAVLQDDPFVGTGPAPTFAAPANTINVANTSIFG